ncbi:MAG: PhzF family phenazine biosynthesis protein [Archangium sp.]
MSRRVDFQVVNVFAETRFGGNQLAVIEDASKLHESELMAICQQFNLSETTFIFPARNGGAARVRIMSPDGEMSFAGHPTLGTAWVVRGLKRAGENFSLELNVGPIPVRAEGDVWELKANAGTSRAAPNNASLAQMLKVQEHALLPGAKWMNTGSEQLLIPMRDPQALAAVKPDLDGLRVYGSNKDGRANVSLFVIHGSSVTSRYFWVNHSEIREDPGTGSACANLGAWMLERGTKGPATWRVEQGHATGRVNHLRLRIDEQNGVYVAGRVIPVMRGTLELD